MTREKDVTDCTGHPAPSPELVELWIAEVWHEGTPVRVAASDLHIATQAAAWGADQELESCCKYIVDDGRWFATPEWRLAELRAARRPKPPSLKEQAQAELNRLIALIPAEGAMAMAEPIRRALETLPDDSTV